MKANLEQLCNQVIHDNRKNIIEYHDRNPYFYFMQSLHAEGIYWFLSDEENNQCVDKDFERNAYNEVTSFLQRNFNYEINN